MRGETQKIVLVLGVLLLVFLFLAGVRSIRHARLGLQLRAQDLKSISKPGDYRRTLTVGGLERSYIVHVPRAYDGRRLLPLVIVLHGGGGNAENAMRMTGMSDKADKEGFLVVYPNGSGRLKGRLLTWNAGYCCGYSLDHKIDDVGFIRALIEDLEKNANIDATRIYATGESNGAMMTYRLGCELSDKIASIAPVAGALGDENCRPEYPLPVIIFQGTSDQHVLYGGGKPKKSLGRREREDKPVSYAVSFWVKHNGCSPVPQRHEKGSIIQETYTSCRDGAEVVLYTIKGGGHAWPGGKKGRPQADEPTQEISATDLMWDFFMRHPKK
jgi:polyhydroxybutyrate depolymerase